MLTRMDFILSLRQKSLIKYFQLQDETAKIKMKGKRKERARMK